MKRLVVLIAAALVVGLFGSSIAFAQEDEEVTVEDVRAEFADLTRSEIEAMGYAFDIECIDASELPPPVLEALGASPTDGMGFHAGNEALFDDIVDPLEPEVIVLDADDNVIAVEYETSIDTEDPTVLGQEMTLLPGGHPGMEFDHYILHVWFIDNPSGQFADFNPNVSCPAAAEQVEAAPATGGYLAGGSNGTATLLIVLASIVGAGLAGAGWTLRRRTSH